LELIMAYPTEVVAKAEYEIGIFERAAADTSQELVDEVKRLRAVIQALTSASDPVTFDALLAQAKGMLPK
jgi:hypothetical protein